MATQTVAAQQCGSRRPRPRPGSGATRGAACARTGSPSSVLSSSSACCSWASSGPIIAPYPYSQQDLKAVFAGGGGPLPPARPATSSGPTSSGRDLLSRLLDGARISVTVALVVQVVILGIGVPIGALAGWFGGRLDNILMRFTDIIYAFPDLLFIILLSVAFRETVFGQALDGLLLVFVAIGLTSWVTVARLVRGQLLSAQGDRVRRGGQGDRRVRSQDRHQATCCRTASARSSSP